MLNFIIQSNTILLSGLRTTLEDTAGIIKGVGKYLNSLTSILDFIAGIIGLDVLLLLIAVAIISSILSLIGIPKGKISFFCSLIIADFFWFLWIKSFYISSDIFLKFLQILKTNLILIIPFLIIHFIRTPKTLKIIARKITRFFKFIFRQNSKIKQKVFRKDEIADIIEKLQQYNMLFYQSMMKDILDQNDKHEFTFSFDTIKYKKELEKLLKGLDADSKKVTMIHPDHNDPDDK